MGLFSIKEEYFYRVIWLFYIFVFLGISFLLFVKSSRFPYACKKTFLFSNITLLAIVISAILIFAMFVQYVGKYISVRNQNVTLLILAGSFLLFTGQLYVARSIYFLTGWDVGSNIIPSAKLLAQGVPLDPFNEAYLSRYPNNIVLVWIISKILMLNAKLGMFHGATELMSIIIFNCFISCLTGFLTYKCVEKLINRKWAFLSWAVYVLLIGTSPWMVITYSDQFSLLLPIFIFFLYTRESNGHWDLFRWFLIGTISFFGYHLKPQVIVIFIAIILIELWKFIFLTMVEKLKKSAVAATLLLTFFLSSIFYNNLYHHIGHMSSENAFGLTHFVMMGLNTETGGIYNRNDVFFSGSLSTAAEREKANITVIKERLHQFGLKNYLKFLARKTLVNYGDGTFAWSQEGTFYLQLFQDRNKMAHILKSLYYSTGSNYLKTSTFEQTIWIGVLASMLGLSAIRVHQLDHRISVLLVSILGLTAFELIFEARARYLFIYAPIYISIAMLGLKNLFLRFE